MKSHRPQSLAPAARWFCAALLSIVSANAVYAQQTQAERWLFVFDLSSQMKQDLPATKAAIDQMLGTSVDGQLHEGDSVGIWTYDQQLHAGQVPLFEWHPARAATISSNLVVYLHRQRYRGNSSLAAMQSFLPQVIAHSERLTTVIFCDGQSQLQGTPYDDGVNQSFLDGLAERKKNRQPFVVVLRTQLGKFVNCTVAYPPRNINFPPFPELPPVTNTPAPPKPHITVPPPVPPLVIIGTHVGTNLNAKPEIAHPTTDTNAVAPVVPAKAVNHPATTDETAPAVQPPPPVTNLTIKIEKAGPTPVSPTPANNVTAARATNNMAAAPPVIASPTNTPKLVVAETVVTQVTASTTPQTPAKPAPPVANPGEADQQSRILIWLGVGLLAAAVVLVILLIVRPGRRPRGSLITSSMQDDSRREIK